MRIRIAALLTISAIIGAACGSSGSNATTPDPPTAPSVPAAQPAAVNVGGGDQTPIQWAGQASDNEAGSGTILLVLHQTGAQVTGTVKMLAQSGLFAGAVSGNTLTFNFSIGNSGEGCGNAIAGTATVSSVNQLVAPPNNTMNTMTATFSGKDCSGKSVTNGTFTASLQDPSLEVQGISATRFPIAGTWTAFLPPPLGGGSWTWTLAQDGDVNGGNLTGSVTVSPDNTLKLGTGTVSGTFTNVFPGAPALVTAVTTVLFTGACPATLTLSWGNFSGDGLQWVSSSFTGTICNGPLPAFKPALKRQ